MRESPFGDLDLNMLAEATRGPGQDTRIWVSYGIVNQETGDDHSVEFDPEWGPLVWVVLQPHDQLVACRVSSSIAGNGESTWHPFLQADEVIVVVPEGDTRSFPVIIGRLNNSMDKFPTSVGGQDTTKNNFGFMRRRGPYLIEGDDAILLRSSVTKAMLGIDAKGNITISCGEKNVMQFGPTGIALQDKDANGQIYLDTESGKVGMFYGGSAMVLNGSDALITTKGKTVISSAGQLGSLHGISAESVVLLLYNTLALLGPLIAPVAALNPASVLGAMQAAIALSASSGYAGAGPGSSLLPTLLGVLSGGIPVTPGTPGVGSPGFFMG